MTAIQKSVNSTEDSELDTQVVPVLFPEQIARAKAILAKHPLLPQIVEAQAVNPEAFRDKAAELCETLKEYGSRPKIVEQLGLYVAKKRGRQVLFGQPLVLCCL